MPFTLLRSRLPHKSPVTKAKPPRPKQSSAVRRDIQGLRALAVLAVVADHLFGYPLGGFVGVDVFFVISGFLITGILLREHDKKGTISFSNFYRRRAKRILPASVFVLVVTVSASYLLFNPGRALTTAFDSVWAFLFTANWRFASVGTDYFEAGGPTSPLQHFWSLAVEEQFYFVWPWLMLLIFTVIGRKAAGKVSAAHRAVGWTMVLIVAASFAWAMYETATSPTWAYFSTFSRAWELGVGALLAVCSSQLRRLPSAIRPALAWAGFAGIVVSLFMVSADSMFPAPWAAAPVLSTALVIAAGTGEKQTTLFPLSNRVSQYIGDISYSLYLWHFPVIIALGALLPKDVQFYATALVLMFALAAVSFHVVEDPVRKSAWLEPASVREKARALRQASGKPGRGQYTMLAFLAAASLSVAGAALFVPQAGSVDVAAVRSVPLANAGGTATAAKALAKEIDTSLQVAAWPELKPDIEELASAKASEWDQCLTTRPETMAQCSFGPAGAKKTAILVGDSVGVSWLPGVRAALESSGWRIQNMTKQQCPAANVEIVATNGNAGGAEIPLFNEECSAHREWVVEQAKKISPDLVIMSNNLQDLSSGAKDAAADAEWAVGYSSYIQEFRGLADRVVVLDLPPVGKNLQECATRINKPSDCTTDVPDYWFVQSRNKAAAIEKAKAAGVDATYVDTRFWVCSSNNLCPAFVGTTPIRADSLHLTDAFARKIAPVLKEALLPAVAASAATPVPSSQEDKVRASIQVTAWGDLNPSLDVIKDAGAPEWFKDDCLNVTNPEKSEACTYGTGAKRAVLVGDSYAISWLPGLRAALEPKGWAIQLVTLGACPNVLATVNDSKGNAMTVCDEHHARALEYLSSVNPAMVIMADNSIYGSQIAGQPKGEPRPELWEEATSKLIIEIQQRATSVVMIGSPPGSGDLQSCSTAFSSPADCLRDLPADRKALNEAEEAAANANKIAYVDPLSWFCADDKCPAVIGSTPVYVDGQHLTQVYSKQLAPLLEAELNPVLTAATKNS